MIHEQQQESAALYALDLLEGDELAAFEAQLARDPELRARVAWLRDTTAQLAHLAPAAEPSPFLRERVLASTRRTAPAPGRRRPVALGWAAAACFAATAGWLGWQHMRLSREIGAQTAVVNALRSEIDRSRGSLDAERERSRRAMESLQAAQTEATRLLASLQSERAQSEQIIAALRSQGDVAELKIQSLTSLLGDSPRARAIAVWNPLTQEGVLTVANLPALEANKDYQLWLLEPQSEVAVDGGVFRVDPKTGEARVTFRPSRAVKVVDKFAVSLEREGGVPKREGPVVLLTQ